MILCAYRWDYDAIHMLPDYMRMSYKALIDTTNEIAHTIREKHGFDPINSLKQTVCISLEDVLILVTVPVNIYFHIFN